MASEEKPRNYLKPAPTNLRATTRQRRPREAQEQVAVVGMGCRFPGGVAGPEDLWELVAAGTDAISEFPADRGWDLAGLFDPDPDHPGTSYARKGGFVHEAGDFDAGFFGISPREALAMDPQQRLLLEVAWEALESAGIDPATLPGSRTGVFAGATPSGYGLAGVPGELEGQLWTGTTPSVISGRVAYALGLEGPAVTVDTSCSSALVALHLACQALRAGECELALAGGVTVLATPEIFVLTSRQRALSVDGRCKAFAAAADGTAWSEGAGMIVLEPVARARARGHRVLAVIRGSAVNSDGASNGLTAPNGASQQRVIQAALAAAGLDASAVDAVEAHGSGTMLGDPIEAQALIAAYGQGRERPVWLGSVKSNIGHTQAAAGVAGLIKMVLALRHEVLPRTLHAEVPSPRVNWDSGQVRLLTEPVPWPADGRVRRAGVSSFGISGTNAHVIVEEPPAATGPGIDSGGASGPLVPGVSVWALSGRSADGLAGQAARLAGYVAAHPGLDLADAGFSLARRSVFGHRAVVVGTGREQLADGLAGLAAGEPGGNVVSGVMPVQGAGKVAFVFPGQGTQWAGMGRELTADCPVFAARLAECAAALAPHVSWDLLEVINQADGAPGLDSAAVAQPVLWAVMVSLAAVWQAAGVQPDAVVGHSQGEIAAATVAGILTVQDAARVVAVRGRLLAGLEEDGGMVSVVMPEAEVRELLSQRDGLSVAAVNGPAQVVVSGPRAALAELGAVLSARRVMRWPVPDTGFVAHSARAEQLAGPLMRALGGIGSRAGRVPLLSTVTGAWVKGPELDGGYWYANVRQTVRFAAAVADLAGRGYRTFIEVSPHPVLGAAVADTIAEAGLVPGPVVGTLHRDGSGGVQVLTALAQVFTAGVPVDWAAVVGDGRRVELPTYAFQRQRYWLTPDRGTAVTEAWRDQVGCVSVAAVPGAEGTAGEAGELARKLAGRSAAEQEELLTRVIRAGAARVLGHGSADQVSPERPFSELGFTSVTALEMRLHLAAVTGLNLPATSLYDYPAPDVLAGYLRTRLTGAQPASTPAPAAVMTGEPVAIVGMGCRFPGGIASPEDLWQLVASGADAIGGFPVDRGWDLDGLFDPDPDHPGTSYVRSGGFVHDAGDFDAGFFSISPREALAMDPQQRLLLETCWEALERAGIDPRSLRGGRAGVFVGGYSSGYALGVAGQDAAALEGHLITGNATSVISGRVAYVLGLEGPAVTVDTACSSSLVAMHLACQALRAGECELALAGGVTILATPADLVGFSRQRGLAGDGRCKAFSAAADGMGMAEGAGMVVLEPLSRARARGHRVLAVIRGSAVNSDGASNGLTAPNGPSQQRVIRAALASAGLSADQVDAVEAHGTGTKLGDPIEAQALIATYGQGRVQGRPVWLGSVKSNIGHTQAAAGVAGVIKMVQALRHQMLPQTLHVEQPSPHVDWDAGDIKLLTEPVSWPVSERPRRAGVSSFGISGTNAHLILEQAPAANDGDTGGQDSSEPPPRVLAASARPVLAGEYAWLLSAQSAAGLAGQARRLAEFVAGRPDLEPGDVGWSLAATRSAFEHRAVVLGSGREELVAGLGAVAAGQTSGNVLSGVAGDAGRVGFVFAGQGTQRAGMGRDLAAACPVFAAELRRVCGLLEERLGVPVAEVVLAGDGDADGRTDQTLYAQAGLFAVEVALVRLLAECGVTPDAVTGHSVGEVAAAYVAGVLSLEDACTLVAARAALMQGLPGGGVMYAVAAPEEVVTGVVAGVSGEVAVAAVNGPASVVVSGSAVAAGRVAEVLAGRGVRVRRLRVSDGFHSPLMDPVLGQLGQVAGGLAHRRAGLVWASGVSGGLAEECEPGYWVRQAREPVRFGAAVGALAAAGVRLFVEIGPDGTLSALGPAAVPGGEGVFIPVQRPITSAPRALLAALAQAHVRGVRVDWPAVLGGGITVELPTYAFQRQRYWPCPPAATAVMGGDGAAAGVEARFWAAVEGQNAAGLAAVLGVEGRALGEVLPALAAWRRRELDASVTEAWRYQVSWVPRADPGPGLLAGSWLLVTLQDGDTELAAGCARTLAARGAAVVTVTAAAADLDRATLAAAVTRALAPDGTGDGGGLVAGVVPVAGVVSLLGVEEQPVGGGGPLDGLAVGVAATQSLVQALGDAQVSAPLWVVTRGAVAAGPGEVPRPVQAQVWGLGRVAALEHPDRWGGLVDLPPGIWEEGSPRSRTMPDERVAGWMCAVLAGCGEDQAAVRGTGIWARRLTPAPRPRLRGGERVPRGSVLITGGTGAIGGRVARWLAGRGTPAVVLTSRSGPAAAGVPALAAQVAAAGTTVQVTACDAASRAELAGLVGQVTTAGRLGGVVHAAGLAQDQTLEQSSTGELAAVLAAKVGGARWLDELTAGLDLDLFVLFSSIAATWGSGGQPGYAAANAHLDALAERRRARGLVATSLAWGPWGGGGMAGQENVAQLRRRGIMPMAPAAAIQALAQAIDAGEHQLTIADVDWARFAPPFTLRRPSPLLAGLPEASQALAGPVVGDTEPGDTAAGASTPLSGQLAGLPLAEQDRVITDLVRAEAAAVLGHTSPEAVEATKAFKEAGFDSLTAIELCHRLGTAIGLNLPTTLLYDYPVPAALAAYLRAVLLGVPDPAAALAAAPAAAVAAGEQVVIVGMGCRFPGGVAGPEDLWELVASGTDAICGFPADRGWDLEALYDPDPDHAGTSYTRWGGFMGDVAGFDSGFFGISPREALAMDPQQRLLLEVGWEALERAGIDPASLRGSRTGVFAGGSPAGYDTVAAAGAEDLGGYLLSGTTTSVLSGRIAYVLGLEGPAVTVDTACSSSLVALHLACQALRAGECELALAGGVTVMATPGVFTEFSRQRGLAVDGRCKSYADAADGTGWAEGAGVLVLEPLSRARAAGHRVLAVIRGSAVNQDGASNGLTAPNGPSQQRVIRAALASAGLDASQVDAVEGHGTGTELGDPIEAQALIATYGQGRDRPVWLGSVKSNIGHPQQAAGVAGVIKMVAAMGRGVIPATLHVDTPSSHVDWAGGQVRLLTEAVPWPSTGQPRRAGVSAFGISGTNAHLILEQAPPADDGDAEGQDSNEPPVNEHPVNKHPVLAAGAGCAWLVSARSAAGLAGQAGRLAEFMARRPDLDPGDVGWSLAATRSVFEHRAVVTGIGREKLVAGLGAVAAGRPAANVASGTAARGGPVRVVFVFAGAGAQWAGMGRDLVRSSPVFAGRLAECGRALAPHVGWDLLDVVNEVEGAPGLQGQEVVQPALWAVSVALAAVWEAAGVAPDAVVGHSQGEIAAATVAGMLSVEDAARVVAVRGRVLAGLGGSGGMAWVAAGAQQVEELLGRWEGQVSVAVVNGPKQVVVAGELAALAEVTEACRERRWRTRVVPVDYASHCALVQPAEGELTAALASIRPGPGRIPMVSGMTGEVVAGSELAAGYWYASCRAPVRFAAAVEALAELGYRAFIEVSPHPVLTGPVSDSLEHAGRGGGLVTGTLRRGEGGPARLLAAFAQAHVQGAGVDWPAVLGGGAVVELPTYAFQRQRFWPRPVPAGAGDVAAAGLGVVSHPLLGAAVQVAGGDQLVLTGRVSAAALPWLADHVVGGVVLVPGTALLEMAIRAGDAAGCGQVTELALQAPLVLPAKDPVQIQVVVGGALDAGGRPVEVFARPAGPGQDGDGPWTCHARGLLSQGGHAGPQAAADAAGDLAAWPPPGAVPADTGGWYERLAAAGLQYGEAFRGLTGAWQRGDEVFAEAVLPEVAGDAARFGLHPALLDAVLHAAGLAGAGLAGAGRAGGMMVPFAWTGVVLHAAGARVLRARLRRAADGAVTLTAADGAGRPVITVQGLALRPVTAAQLQSSRDVTGQELFSVDWVPVPAGPVTGTWAVAGPDPYQAAAGLAAAGAPVSGYPDLAALAAAISGGASVPDLIAITAGPGPAGAGELDAGEPDAGDDAGDDAGVLAQVLAGQVLGVVQDWLAGPAGGARLVVLTRGTVPARPGDRVSGLAGAAVWGLVRSVQAENPDRVILADLPAAGSVAAPGSTVPAQAFVLLAAAAGSGEPEVAVRDGQLYGRRLGRPARALPVPGGTQPWRLAAAGGGTLDELALVPCPQAAAPLGAGQVRVAVRAAGLNFRDVLISLGMYPGEGMPGSEIAGIVTGTGAGVCGLVPGDRVLGMADGGFGPVAVTDARLLVPVPAGWSFTTAAAVPVAFLTAWYGLVDLAGARAGQRLLVHAATGGVGMAAVSIGRYLGLEVFGTASPGKHPVLAALGLDADHVGSSRDASFAARFGAVTGGAGMDIVLNALAGELTDASLGLLPRGGVFVEMGKTDRRDPARVAGDYPGVCYRAFDVAEAGPDRLGQILAEVTGLLAAGVLALPPVMAWDVRQAPEAFRYMSQARHTGKIVLTIPAGTGPGQPGAARPAGTVLVTGGTGTLGALTARHLAATGRAAACVLVSRSGPAAPGAAALAAGLARAGAGVAVLAADLARPGAAAAVTAAAAADGRLSAVIHAAGVIDDATIATMTPGQVRTVMAPKAAVAWQLHQATKDRDLDGFVMFSSAASVLGGAGQGNYAAANAFLDALATYRHAAGLPAQSLAWGLWEPDSAMTAGLGEAGRARITRSGMTALTPAQGLALLDAAAAQDRPLLLAARLDIDRLRAQAARGGALPPLWHTLAGAQPRPTAHGNATPGEPSGTLRGQLAALAPSDREHTLTSLVCEHAAAVLGHPGPAAIDPSHSFTEHGFDSLTAIELRNRLATATGLTLPATLTFDYPTPATLAIRLRTAMFNEETSSTVVFKELDKLKSVLMDIAENDGNRSRIITRLEAVLQDFRTGAAGNVAALHEIDEATDDEIFDLLDKELGI